MTTLTVAGIEGVVVKDLDSPYPLRSARVWSKVKTRHSLDLVVTAVTGDLGAPTSLVLALPTVDGFFEVGTTTVLSRAAARDVTRVLRPTGQTGRHFPALPGTQDPVQSAAVEPFVVEVHADVAIDNGRLRHPARLTRLRPDLTPSDLLHG